jgi:hypothetical protein
MSTPSTAAPVDTLVEIPEEPAETEYNVILPRGLVLRGRVVDATSGRGVDQAKVSSEPKPEDHRPRSMFSFTTATDAEGRYRLAVPPGRGTIGLRRVPRGFLQPEPMAPDQPFEAKFAHDVAGVGGQAERKVTRVSCSFLLI